LHPWTNKHSAGLSLVLIFLISRRARHGDLQAGYISHPEAGPLQGFPRRPGGLHRTA
jgi:hypothetical protein